MKRFFSLLFATSVLLELQAASVTVKNIEIDGITLYYTVSGTNATICNSAGTSSATTAAETELTGIYYDLQGRAVGKPAKGGIYIRDGKKIIMAVLA